jgi:hypothetical protein
MVLVIPEAERKQGYPGSENSVLKESRSRVCGAPFYAAPR